MDSSPQITRLVHALKGTGRFANPKARVVLSQSTTRDLLVETGFGNFGSVKAQGSTSTGSNGVFTLIDPSGKPYALTNIVGFANGAVLHS